MVNLYGFLHGLCSGHRLVFLWHSHTIFGTRVSPLENVLHIFMTTGWPWPLAWITKLYFHNEFVSGQDSLCFLTQAYQV